MKWITLDSDLEALLVEAELIRTHQPKYNLRLKDDKSPIYIITTKEQLPRVLIKRKSDLKQIKSRKIFGPFTSQHQTTKLLKITRSIFPFCSAARYKQLLPCFYSHIGLCAGVCSGNISHSQYLFLIGNLEKFLKGKKKHLVSNLKRKMQESSKNKSFEEAAKLRDTIILLQNSSKNSFSSIRFSKSRLNPLEQRRNLWQILFPLTGKKSQQTPSSPYSRIEAYDISNTSGKLSTASMVVFSNGVPDKNQYRKFRIKLENIVDDPRMMNEVLTRRLNHRDWKYPELILVDGGKAQIKAARQALAGYGLHHKIQLVALAKKFESLIVYKQTFHVIRLPKSSSALLLLIRIRDEAHRFAKNYHKKLRSKALLFD